MRELEAALSAAKEAGEVLRGDFGRRQTVRYKGRVTSHRGGRGGDKSVSNGRSFPPYQVVRSSQGSLIHREDRR
jgi:hypothetical protein